MMGLSDGRKSFQIGLAVLIQYPRVTDTQPASHDSVARTPLMGGATGECVGGGTMSPSPLGPAGYRVVQGGAVR